jgi:hypothetical protein
MVSFRPRCRTGYAENKIISKQKYEYRNPRRSFMACAPKLFRRQQQKTYMRSQKYLKNQKRV